MCSAETSAASYQQGYQRHPAWSQGLHFSFLEPPAGVVKGSCHLSGFSAAPQAQTFAQSSARPEAAQFYSFKCKCWHGPLDPVQVNSLGWISGPPTCWNEVKAGRNELVTCGSASEFGAAHVWHNVFLCEDKGLLIDKGHTTYAS